MSAGSNNTHAHRGGGYCRDIGWRRVRWFVLGLSVCGCVVFIHIHAPATSQSVSQSITSRRCVCVCVCVFIGSAALHVKLYSVSDKQR